MSGVNWIRENFASTVRAIERTARVLARPGTPSTRICPPVIRPITMASSISLCPTTTFWASRIISSIRAACRPASSLSMVLFSVIIAFQDFKGKIGTCYLLHKTVFCSQKYSSKTGMLIFKNLTPKLNLFFLAMGPKKAFNGV